MAYFFHAGRCALMQNNFKFRKMNKLKSKQDFQAVYTKGRTVVDALAVFYISSQQDDKVQIGLAVGKKIGCAVTRNHVKRMMREVFRMHLAELKTGYQIVWVARKKLAKADYKTFERVFLRLAKRAALLKE